MPTNPFSGGTTSGGTSANPFGAPSSSKKPKAPPNPQRQFAAEAAKAQQTLAKIDPKKAAILGDLIRRYGMDIPPEEAARAGLKNYGNQPTRLYDQVKAGGMGVLGRVGSVLSRAQQTVYGAIHPNEPGESRASSALEGLTGKQYQTLAQVTGKEAPTSGPLLGLRRTIFKGADFIGGAATDPLSYATFGATAAAKSGLSTTARAVGAEAGEAVGRQTATQVAKQGLRSLSPETRATIEQAIREGATAKGATRSIASLEKGASKARFMGRDLGYHNLPRRSEEILGQAAVGERVAAESVRAGTLQTAKDAVQAAKDFRDVAKATVDSVPAGAPRRVTGAAASASAAAKNPNILEERAAELISKAKAMPAGAARNKVEQDAAEMLSRAKEARRTFTEPTAQETAAEAGTKASRNELKNATADLKKARTDLKAVTGQVNRARVIESEKAFAAVNRGKERAAGLKEAFSPRAALRSPAERRVFAETASEVQGVTRKLVGERAFTLTGAMKAAGVSSQAAEAPIVQSIKDAVETAAQATAASGTSGRTLSTTISRASALKALADVKLAHPEWAGILDALPPLGSSVKTEAISKAKSLGDIFETHVGSPIRSSSQASLKATLQARGLDAARRPDVGKAVTEWKSVHLDPLDVSGNPKLVKRAVGAYRRAAVRTPGFFAKNTTTDYGSVVTEMLSSPGGAAALKSNVGSAWSAARALNTPSAEWVAKLGADTAEKLRLAVRHDVTGADVFHDVAKGTVEAQRRRFSPIRLFDKVAAAGRQTSEHARLSLFFSQLDQGLDAAQAAANVRNALGDYSDYTRFEQATIRNHVVPFYKFHRFNTPFQLAKMVTSPKTLVAEQHARASFGSTEGPVGTLPQRLSKFGILPLGGTKFLDTNTGIEAAGQAIDPLVQLGAEAASHIPGSQHVGLVGDLQAEPGQGGGARGLTQFIGGPTTAGLVKEMAQWVAGEDFFTGAPITDQGKLRHLYTQMLPELGRAMRITSAEQGDYPRILMSILAGISTMDASEASQRAEIYRRLDVLNKLINDAKVDGKGINLLTDLGVSRNQSTKLPTLTELRDQGLLPDPTAKAKGPKNAANPFS